MVYCFSYSILERLGLSSSEAHRRLVNELTGLTARNSNLRRWIFGVFLPPYRFINVLLTHVGAVSLLVSYVDNPEWNLLVEGVILLLLGSVNFFLLVRENYCAYNGCLRKLKETAQVLRNNAPSSHYPSEPIATARGQLTISVLRDHVTVNVPASLLVDGDVILLAAKQICPANVTKVNNSNVRLLKGHAVTEEDLDSGSNAFFKVTETPLLSLLQSALSHQQDASILESERDHVYKIIHVYLFWGLLLLLVILAIIKQTSLSNDTGTWSEIILRLPTYSLLPLLLPPFPLYWWLGNRFALAKLSAMFDAHNPTRKQLLMKTLKLVFNYPSNLNYSFLHFLGTVTTFCAVDKEYLLSTSHPLPEKVFFFHGTEVLADSCDSLSPKDHADLPSSKNDSSINLPADRDGCSLSDSSAGDLVMLEAEVLQISPSQDSHSGIFFDNSEWHLYLSSLNPIALCSKITSHMPRFPHIDVHLSEHLRHTQCSCPLAIEVGVADLDFKPSTTVFVVDNKRRTRSTSSMFQLTHSDNIPIHMVSMVIQGKKCSQLMSAGSAHMILSCCSDLWDGQDLIPMTNLECKKVMEFFNRRSVASYCIGLAYNPLLEQLEEMQSVYVIKEPDQQVPKQLQGQVFLGMLSLQYHPAPDMVELVEQLDIAGVRFVHFAAENELQIRGFTEKLGLEVGWNCHISLSPDTGQNETQEKDDEVHPSVSSSISSISLAVNDIEAYNRAKLPKGVKLIRSHIENVDNVPLLVPLFTDCTAASIAEMMLIMQENGDVVVCIGSSWNTDNIATFSQANVSIAVEPDDSSSRSGNLAPDDGTPTQLHAASLLNSCPCDLVISRNSDPSTLLMILHSRHLLSCLRQSLLFGLGGSLLLTGILIGSDVMFLPPALNGSHIFWFSFFVLPLISSSLLGSSPNKEELKNKMMDKNNKLWIKQWRYLFYFTCSFLSTAVLCLLLFAITLDNICSEISDNDCHPLLGDRNETSQWNGWQDRYSGGLLLAQNVTAFFLCCYLIILSFHFSLQIIPLRQFRCSLQLPWLVIILVVLLLQVVFFVISIATDGSPDSQLKLSLVPVWVWPFGVAWGLVLVVVQELIKLREKKLMSHTQKHLRLEFGTKLGMNSPF